MRRVLRTQQGPEPTGSKHRAEQPSRLIGLFMLGFPLLGALLLAMLITRTTSGLNARPTFAVPVPVYQVEADGGPNYSHHASLLNLNLGQPGVPQVPTLVDTDGDLLPDVSVSVNLINVDGRFLNPPRIGQILAPNIEINRLITAPILGQVNYPLRIQVKLTVQDVFGTAPDTVARFGYDTGRGGSIPPFWKATVAGLDTFFNPVQAVIDTTGQQLGLHPGITDFGLGPIAAPYQGPLRIIGGFESGTTKANLDLAYRPFPNAIGLSYGTDSQGQHIGYAHGYPGEVDLTSTLKLQTATQTMDTVARVDRIPRSMNFDVNQNSVGGSVDYRSITNKRLPDAQVDVTTTAVGKPPLVARADIEALPTSMHGEWTMNNGQPAHVAFNASGTGVGAIEARVANYAGAPTKLVPWVPSQQQYASYQSVPISGGTEQLIMGRAERLRNMSFDQDGDGYVAHVGIGDGELPFVANIGLDNGPGGGSVDAQAQIAPLPDSIDMAFSPPGGDQSTDPLRVSYDASQTTDIDAHAEVRLPEAVPGASCGADNTICADFAGRNIPAHIEARVIDGSHTPNAVPETRIELDDIPRPGGVQPDFHAHVIVGQEDNAPIVADADLDGLSRFIRMRTLQGADETLQRMELHTCNYNYDTRTCAAGSEDEIGAVRLNVRNFQVRPANLPPPTSSAPLFAGVTARGDDTNVNLVRFEAVARMSHLREVQYVNDGGTFGARTRIGGGKNLAVDVDVAGVRMSQFPDNRIDLAAHALITPLPDTINLCVQNSGGPLVSGTDPVTQGCQRADPFGDDSVEAAPIVFDWQASSPFTTTASARIHMDEGTPGDPSDDLAAGGRIKVAHIPSSLNATVAVPAEGETGPIRVLTTGPAGSNIDVDLHGEMTRGGADCNDPLPNHDVACGDVTIDDLPTNMSILIDPTKNASRAEFHACDYRFNDATPACRAGTAGEIGVLAVGAHLVKGHPGSLGVLEPTTDQHAFLQYRQRNADNLALRARARFEKIRSVAYRQSSDGFDASYDLGNGIKPFEAKVQADTRTGSLPDADGLKAAAEVLISPLPQQIDVNMHGPTDGPSAAPMKLTYNASSPIRVQAHAQVFRAGAGSSCGDNGTACATVDIKRVPAHMEATIGQSESALSGGAVDHQTVINFVSDAPIGAKPDVIIDAIAGLPTTTPLVGSVPVRAHAELLGLPRYVTAHLDEHVTNPGAANEKRDLERVSFRTCQVNNAGNCVVGTEDALDTLSLVAHNFLTRPINFPAANAGVTEPLWATVTGRGKLFQAAITLKNIREASYVNHQTQGTKGFRVRVGSNQNLQALVDIKGLPVGNLNFGNMAIQDATLDARANVLIKPLPDDIRICLRQSGLAIEPPTTDPITDVCEENAPFGASIGQVPHTPMSVAYRASVPINRVETTVDVALNGKEANNPLHPAIKARKLHGELNIDNIPKTITAHILTPVDDADGNAVGATRVVYDAPSTGPGLGVHFRAHQTVGDAVCQDPRPSATALCVGADLSNLPKHVELRYEPDQLSNNFHAGTSSDFNGKMNFTNLELSSVKPKVDGSGNPIAGKADVLVATGQILGIDDNITVDGNINMPHDPNKAGSIDLTASVRIDQIDATVRNYIAPDPFTAAIPARPVYKDAASAAVLNSFTVRARPLPDGSPVFKAEVAIKKVAGFGYHQIADATGAPTGTSVLNIDFAKDFAARAYADVVLADGTAIRGDVLLEHIPAGLQMCFRGSRPASTPAPATGQPNVWCDDTVATKPEDGAFQFLGTPANPALSGLDVDAFVRMAAPNGTDIVTGRINITGIPYRIDGILPSEDNGGRLDIAGKKLNGDPLGIKQIKFAAASFDLPSGSGDLNSGYSSATPGFVPLLNQTDPFPAPTFSTQYTSVAASGDPSSGPFDFQAVGRLGDENDSVSSSRLQRIYSSSTACSNRANRPDFPMFPTNDNVSTYRCIGADLEQTDPTTPDPFALAAIYKAADGKIVRLRNAGINDMPGYFQVNIAKTSLVQGANDALRRRCGSAANETSAYNTAHSTSLTQAQAAAQITDCMPPLLRFDQPLASARLFGVAEFGTPADLVTLASTQPKEALADLDAIPRGDGWGATTGDTAPLKGIRAKVITVGGRTAARASFRLPIPQSVTVDQVQSASSHGEADAAHYFDASDLRFHFIVRDGNGDPVANLGELSALYQAADGSQILVGNPCQLNARERVTNNSLGSFNINSPFDCNPDWRHGLLIPGEIGISMYTRNNLGTGQKYIQIDGRLSTDESAAVRMIGNDPTGAGRIEAEIKNIPGPLNKNGNEDSSVGADDATFRIQFLMKGEKQTPPSGTPPTPPAPPSECVLCVTTNIRLAQAFVSFDFWPDHSVDKARRVEATLNHDGAKNGLELQSFNQVKGGTNVAVEADAYVQLDPLNLDFYLNLAPTLEALGEQAVDWVVDALDLPGWVEDILDVVVDAIADLLASLVNLDATLTSRLDASVELRSSHLTLRQNILHVKVKNMGSASDGTGNAKIGPIDWYVQELKANANLGFTIHTPWPFPDINIGLTLLTVYYVPVAYNIVPFLFKYLRCSGDFWDIASDVVPPLPGDTISAGPNDTDDVVIWPLWEPRLVLGGIIGGLINGLSGIPMLRNLGGLFFCIPGADDGDVPLGPPGDTFQTVAGGLWPQHPIFDSDAMADSVLTAGAPGGIGAPPPIVTPPTPDPVPPAPAPNGPNYTVFGTDPPLELCGVHAFGNLTVQNSATIKVATAADSANPTGTGANCAAGDVGKLMITVDNLTNHGTIEGNATQGTQPQYGNPAATLGTAATGNSGAGHAGAGGNGSSGTGGTAYSKTSNADPEKNGAISEQGAPGGATSGTKPKGGGLLMLLANDSIVSDGTISADGADGVANTTGACAFDETVANPSPPPANITLHHNNTGVAAPAGAGSGGGIVLSAPTIDLRNTTNSEMHAKGGAGANSRKGASGGGGGGVIKLLGPIQLFDAGFAPGVGGGAAGTNLCAGDGESAGANPGGSGVIITVATPTTRAYSPAAFWNNGSSITVPFEAKAAYQNAGGYQVILCGIQSTTTTAPSGGTLFDRFTVPASNSTSNPCGTGATQLASKSIASGDANAELELGDAAATITFSRTGAANNGIWGLYTVVARPTSSCIGSAPACVVSGLPQPEFDASNNTTIPAKVNTIVGIDNSNPTVAITAPTAGFLTKTPAMTVSFTYGDQDTPVSQALSHAVKTECRNSAPAATPFVSCGSGSTFNLVPGNGPKTIQVRVTDGAGNTATASVSGILSNSPPTATATIQFGPNGSASWYTSAPTITLSGYTQGDGVPAEPSVDANSGPYRWRFDSLPENVCTATPCTVPASAIAALPAGTHTFSYTAVDALGNRLFGDGMQSTINVPSASSISSFKWDPDKPTTQFDTVPFAPNAVVSGDGWYTTQPFVVLSALDALGGSGLNQVKYRVDGSGAFLTYNSANPPQLGPGIHTVEYFSTDMAGNTETTHTSTVIRVDDVAPDSSISVAGGVLGDNSWYTTPPIVSVGGFNDFGGTGAPATKSLRYRVDNGDELTCNSPCNLAPLVTGTHFVRLYAVDAVGNAHSETERIIKVDTQVPDTTIALRSTVPDGLNGWYLSLPFVELGADDQPADYTHVLPFGSGVFKTEYQLDGGSWDTYTGPFQVAGDHTLCARSIDNAGLVEPVNPADCFKVKGDDANPTTSLAVAGPLGLNGWYTNNATVTVTSSDPVPGSGLVQAGAVGTPCYDAIPAAPVPAGTCVSVDGRAFEASVGSYVLGEGVHKVQAYSVDAAGHRSTPVVVEVEVDKSAPVTSLRTLPPYPARNGWFRAVPRVVLRATDGDQNSGLAETYYKVDSGAFQPYTGPFDIGNGLHTVSYYSVDLAGRQEATKTFNVKVDTTPPVAIATNPIPAIWLKLLSVLGNLLGFSPPQAKLQWTIGDQYSGKLSVRTLVYDVTGNVVRQLECELQNNQPLCFLKGAPDVPVLNPITVTPGVNVDGYVKWDGRDLSLTGVLPVGLYYYRVVVTDDAGNVAQSGESRPIQIKAG